MKDIRIFVASSKELLPERNYLAYLVLASAEDFERRGFRVRLSKWEYVDPTMTEARTEDRYLDEMLDCDAVLMMFRHVLGMYTKEEVDKAIAAEEAGTSRIKKHLMLFKDGDVEPSAELAAWRATLPEGTYGTFTGFEELKAHFLRLVEELSGLPLQDISQEGSVRSVSAFLAVDDELAADRNAFADAVLNLNDVLVRRGARVRLRFYDPEKHRELLESSEMALVLYHTKCGDFGEAALDESYDRSKRDENPKRLYVFFRDADGKPLADGFDAFKDGFAGKFGSAPCRFENVDTLSLNFLFSLESILGDDGGTFVKLDGRTVVADGLEVGDLAKLPMLEKNEGLASLFSRMQEVSKRFVDQRGKCEKEPQNDGLYVELLDISAEKNRLQDQIDRELKMSFNLAKRMAAVSIVQTNDTIARARAKMDEGKIKEALEILDGASAAMKRRRLLHRAAERAEAEELQIKELKAGVEIEYFRVDAIMAYTAMPFEDRFKKSESVLNALVEDVGKFSSLCSVRWKTRMEAFWGSCMVHAACLYDEIGEINRPITLLEKALDVFVRSDLADGMVISEVINTRLKLGEKYHQVHQYSKALVMFDAAIDMCGTVNETRVVSDLLHARAKVYKDLDRMVEAVQDCKQALSYSIDEFHEQEQVLHTLARIYADLKQTDKARDMYMRVLEIRRLKYEKDPLMYGKDYAAVMNNLALIYDVESKRKEAQEFYEAGLSVYRYLQEQNPYRYTEYVADILNNIASMYAEHGEFEKAREEFENALVERRHLALKCPEKFDSDVADVLDNLGNVLHELGLSEKAEKSYEEALSIRCRLSRSNPRRYNRDVACSMSNLGVFYYEENRFDDAAKFLKDASSLYEELFIIVPERYKEDYLESLRSLLELYERMDWQVPMHEIVMKIEELQK